MRAVVTTEALRGALARLKAVFGGAATLPVLNMVLMAPEGAGLRLSATNLDTSMSVLLAGRVEGGDSLCVPGARLLAACGKLAGEEVELCSEKNALIMTSEDWWLKLFTLSADEFPPPARPEGGTAFALEGSMLARPLRAALRSVSSDETRYVLNGVFFEIDAEGLRLVSTDGRRLFHARLQVEAEERLSTIVPADAVKHLVELGEAEESVSLRFAGAVMECCAGAWTMGSRLIEGVFPNYAQVIPARGAKYKLRVPRKGLLAALPFIEAVASKNSAAVRLVIPAAGRMSVEMATPEIGEAHVAVDSASDGGELTVGFNGLFLRDVLSSFSGDEVTIEMDSEQSAALVEEASSLAVLMPLRIS